ncbi:MAG: flagellar basal body-associated FliL family protein [Bdellovibrionales bacterium]|nr:flagellar basal body-associated FliL family protein [Bdellovibrionales bacterium]
MAEEAKSAEGAPEGEEGAAPAKKKFDPLLLAISGQLLIVLAAGGLIAKVALTPRKVDLRESTLKERAIASIRDDDNNIQFVEFKDFAVNLPQHHTIKTKIQVEVSDPEVAAKIQARMPAIRSRVIDLLSTVNFSDAEKLHGKLLMKDVIRDALNEIISANEKGEKKGHSPASNGVVREVYFVDFIMI